MGTKSDKNLEDIVERIRGDIIPMFEKIIANDTISFRNPHIVRCWKAMECKITDCPLYGDNTEELRCWQVKGTYCGGTAQGPFIDKYGRCSKCNVFKDSCPTVVEEIGEHFNNMVYLLNKQKQEIMEDKDQIERLNQELISAVEELDMKNRKIQEMMITDKLTGLYNRYHLVTVLEDEIARCKRYHHSLSLMMIDIDKFKTFNDSYGHLAGDAMLSFIGSLIRERTRKFDRAFRYGGEEFVVMLPETDFTMAYVVAERLRKDFAKKIFTVSGKEGMAKESASRTISIGITSTTAEKSIEQLIHQADKALYEAKGRGGNVCIRFEESEE